MEIAIIGAGPGGYVAALYAAKRGIKVTLIEKAEVGGVCLNRGCIPTKALLHSANLFHRAKSFADLGIKVTVEGIDYDRLLKRRDNEISRLRTGVEFLLKKAGVALIRGEASFVDNKQVRILSEAEEKIIRADKIIIAAGATPAELSTADVNGREIINSDHALTLTELPESMAIIGGGVIGCEFAQAFARLGSKITVIETAPRLLPGMDKDISGLITKVLTRDGVEIHLNARVTGVEPAEGDVRVRFESAQGIGSEIIAQKSLVAIGRKPNLSSLGLEKAGILHEKGFICVDDYMHTNIPGIYAIGDITGGMMLAHIASYGGIVAVKHILGIKTSGMSGSCVPVCIYTDPEIACAGLMPETSNNEGYQARTGIFPFSANARAIIEQSAEGFAKMLLDNDGTIIGAHLVGANVTEMISFVGGFINFQAAAEDMEELIFAHPSISECIGEGVAAADKMAIHIP